MHIGPYELKTELGRGGMGRVVCAVGPDGVVVAVKTVRPAPGALGAIRREIAALARIRLPGVARIRGHGVDEGQPWYAMDHVDGTPLDRWAEGRSLDAILAVMAQLAVTLEGVHGLGVVHRDLKPANVLVDREDRPILVDFGVSVGGRGAVDAVLPEGEGTVGYMPREQLLGEPVDARADLDAFGVLLHELVSGRHPFEGVGTGLVLSHLSQNPRRLLADRPDVPLDLDRLVWRLLAKRREGRPGYASDVVDALDAIRGARTPRRSAPTYLYPASFVGRERELGALREALDGLSSLRGGVGLVTGASGSGKSRLAAELAQEARSRGYGVIACTCRPGGGPLHGWLPVLQRLADRAREGGLVAEEALLRGHGPSLPPYAPFLAHLESVRSQGPAARLDPDVARVRLMEALVGTLVHLAGAWPALLVVVDDVQWADEATLALLRELAGPDGGDEPILVLGLCRAESLEPVNHELGDRPLRVRVDLEPMEGEAMTRMVREMLALEPGAEAELGPLLRRCGGSPFFAAELLPAGRSSPWVRGHPRGLRAGGSSGDPPLRVRWRRPVP